MEEINISSNTKRDQYRELIPQIISLLSGEENPVANMANTVAALKQTFSHYSWVGFYLMDSEKNELVLGPFQGKIACTRIGVGRGVCGSSVKRNETIIVPDVEKFPGHIYCDGGTKSEIVIPLRKNGAVIGVLDVDSYHLASFDETDKEFLEQLLTSITDKIATAS